MKSPIIIFLIGILACTAFTAFGQKGHIKIEKEPIWITVNTPDYKAMKLDREAEDGIINLNYEYQIYLAEKSVFHKTSIKIISEAGVQNNSQVSINFNPSYQDISIHTIRIIRGSQSINQLDLSKIKTIHQEKELDKFIYNGSLTAMLILEDVRKGDIIEYSYTIKGFNPIFNNKYSDIYDLQFAVPVYNIYYKLIVPDNRIINIKNSQTKIQPVISKTAKETIYEWKAKEIPSMQLQDNTPVWYNPYASVMVSEFKNWKEVNDMTLPWFQFNTPLSTELQHQITSIYKSNLTPEKRVTAALRFVQDEIRYMGVEMGENSYKPHKPDQVFKQRFGDCKDKSYLLCTMLRNMGIEANLVLINTNYKKTLLSFIPSLTVFDHVTIRIKLNNSYYWFDPTISNQRGELKDIYYPDYQTGLLISDTTTALTSIPFHSNNFQKIKEVFNIKNMAGSAQLIVTTNYHGTYADDNRDYYKNNTLKEIQKNYLKLYSSYFDKITPDSLIYSDDEKEGSFNTIEYYTIDDFWGTNSNFKKASFEPFVINTMLKKPKEFERSMPYSIAFPANYDEELEVNLPESWITKSSSHKINCSGFSFNSTSSLIGRRLTLNYKYESLKDHIEPDETKDYITNINKVDEHLGYDLTLSNVDNSGSSGSSDSGGYPSIYLALGICVFITYIVRKNKRNN